MPLKTAALQILQASHAHYTAPPTINSILTNNYISTTTNSLLHSLDYDTFLSCLYQLVHGEIFHECNNQTSCGRVLICSPEGVGGRGSMSQYNSSDSNKATYITNRAEINKLLCLVFNKSLIHPYHVHALYRLTRIVSMSVVDQP